jgi:hypothetical protein
VSVDFDPVRVRPNRRRIDPVVVGIIVVLIALAVAIIKPWEDHDVAIVTGPSSAAPAVAASTDVPGSDAVGPIEHAQRVPGRPPPTWSDLAPALTDHATWGVAAVVLGPRAEAVAPSASGYLELWSPAVVDDAGVEDAYVARAQESIVALGVTVPRSVVPEDVRIWRIHDDGGLEWIDADPVVGRAVDGTVLTIQPGSGGAAFTSWTGGHYRIDVLLATGIHRIALQIPGRFGNVPPPDPWPAAPPDLAAAKDGDPLVTRQGPFALEDGVGVALSATPGTLLDEDAEWRAARAASNSHGQSVAAVHLPRATGLGVMFTENAVVHAASIKRLAPDAQVDTAPVIGGISSIHGRTPYLVFTPVGEGAWTAGVYALSAAWTDATGIHSATWPVELRPGVPGLGSTTAFGPDSGG